MAHNLAEINGRVAMAYQGETPWHKLGTRMPAGQIGVAAALIAAGLDWTVSLRTMHVIDRDDENALTTTLVPNRKAVMRDTDGKILSTVSGSYKTIQYPEAFGIFQPAVEEFGLTVEAAGALGQGEKAWMLFKLPENLEVTPGDHVNGYGVAIAGHDGSTAFEFRPTPIRVVCQNTLQAAIGHGGAKGRVFGIAHIGNTVKAVAKAKELVRDVLAAMTESGTTFTQMARKRMTPEEVIGFIESVFPANKENVITPQIAERRQQVSELIWRGNGAELAMQETGGEPNPWACYNAVTEYFDHVYTADEPQTRDRRSAGKRADAQKRRNASALFGSAADIKALALRMAQRQLVAA
jgi:phage/plasmid-like protein (TIGR03299 family)